MSPPRILVTRAMEDATDVSEAIRLRGGVAEFLPMHRIIPLDDAAPSAAFSAVLATSAKAFHHQPSIARTISRLPVFCVGPTTAKAAEAAGFTQILVAEGSAKTLITLIENSSLTGKALLYLAGTPRRPAIEEWAGRTGTSLTLWQRYRIEPVHHAGDHIRAILRSNLAAILHFSPESARRFVEQCRASDELDSGARPVHACISEAVAHALQASFAAQSLDHPPLIAALPSLEALLDDVFRLFTRKR